MGRTLAARTLAGRLVQSRLRASGHQVAAIIGPMTRTCTRTPAGRRELSGRHSLKIMFNSDVTAPMTLTLLGLPWELVRKSRGMLDSPSGRRSANVTWFTSRIYHLVVARDNQRPSTPRRIGSRIVW